MLEPHNTASIARQRMESLWNARWDEHVAESHIRQLGQMLGDVSEELAENPLPAYDTMRNASKTRFASVSGTEKGDPNKAVEAIVDVVRGEGVAKGRPWPGYLVLGEDAEIDVRTKCKKVLDVLDEWVDVARDVNFDVPPA